MNTELVDDCFSSEIILGDINYNGLIDIVYIILMINMILNDEYTLPADMNSDGIVNILDILDLVNYILAE